MVLLHPHVYNHQHSSTLNLSFVSIRSLCFQQVQQNLQILKLLWSFGHSKGLKKGVNIAESPMPSPLGSSHGRLVGGLYQLLLPLSRWSRWAGLDQGWIRSFKRPFFRFFMGT